ncbi:uncharacterized protein LOC121872127 [Homarus americanus]|uniref:uncharacterized protein LOC121872127 n=1 Tax=Homarus americanus TaxID=6706 RepID=UPI001C445A5B|nr:uncharacterized protein LOC121872127 [Homarus americanus]
MNGPTELDLAGVMEKLRDRENPPEGMNPSTRPVVVVEGVEVDPVVMEGDIAEGYWAGIPPQLSVTNWGTPSGPSSDSCSSSRSPSLLSMYSDGSWNDGYTTQAPNDSAPARVSEQSRCRHASTSISHPADPCENNLANARFCASQDNLGPQADYTKRKHSLKNMFLDVFHLESSHRKRSASSAEGRHRAHSSGDSPVKKLISRIRSRSSSDLLSRSSSSGSVDLEQEKEVNLNPEVRDGEVLGVDSLPATAINTRLVGRFRKNNANQKKRRWSLFDQHIMKSQDSPPDEASEYNVPLKYENEREGQGRWVVTLEMPGESKTDKGEAPPEVFKDSSDASHQKPRLVRTRSNSESTILVVEKKRKKRKDSRMIDRLLDFRLKKSLLRGSLPTLLGDKVSSQPADTKIPSKLLEDNENVFTDNLPVPGDVPSTFKTPRTQSMQNLTDYAVDDYFSPEIDRRYSTDDMDSYRESDRNKENLPHYLTVDQSRNRRHRFSIDNLWNALKGKSRSVDHTIHNPFDLDALRRKIGERTTSEPSRDISSPSPGAVPGVGVHQASRVPGAVPGVGVHQHSRSLSRTWCGRASVSTVPGAVPGVGVHQLVGYQEPYLVWACASVRQGTWSRTWCVGVHQLVGYLSVLCGVGVHQLAGSLEPYLVWACIS